MTNIRTNSLQSKAALDQHFADYDAEPMVENDEAGAGEDVADLEAVRREIAWLRKEVADLRTQLAPSPDVEAAPVHQFDGIRPWARIAFSVAATYVLGKLVERFRLGAPGAAAVPMITAQLSNMPMFR